MTNPNPTREALKAAALEATRGPWMANSALEDDWQIDAAMDAVATTLFCYAPEKEANARYIALAHPQAILELLERCEMLEGAIQEACKSLANISKLYSSDYADGTRRALQAALSPQVSIR